MLNLLIYKQELMAAKYNSQETQEKILMIKAHNNNNESDNSNNIPTNKNYSK